MNDVRLAQAFEAEELEYSRIEADNSRHVGDFDLWRYDKHLLWAFGEARLLEIVDHFKTTERKHIVVNTHNRRSCKQCNSPKIAKREIHIPLLYLVDMRTQRERLIHSGKALTFSYYYCPWCDGIQPSFEGFHVIRVRDVVRKTQGRLTSGKTK